MKYIKFSIFALAFLVACSTGTKSESNEESAPETETEVIASSSDASVHFILPHDGDTVSSPVKVTMGVSGMEVEPAGEVKPGKGHHHLVIDGSFIPEGEIVPADSTHIHYGKGQTEVELDLSPGSHTLTMQFADGVHASYGESMSATITIVVD